MSRASLVMLVFASSVATWSGCTDGKSEPDSGTTSTDETGSSGGGDDGEDPGPLGALTGIVVDNSSAPLEGVSVQLCREVCKLSRTDGSGAFHVEAAPGRWAFEVIVDTADPTSGWATPLSVVDIMEDVDRALTEPVVVPRLDAVVPLASDGPVEVGSGLWLDVVASEWEPPVLTPDAEPWVGGVQVDAAALGLPLDGVEQGISAAWYIAPVDCHPQQPWAMSFTNTFEWTAGQSADVWVADYGSQSWQSVGPVTVSEDGAWLRGAHLSVFGTVLLLTPDPAAEEEDAGDGLKAERRGSPVPTEAGH